MKINKKALLWAIKKSASISEVAQRMGRESIDEEKIWTKIFRYYPSAEDYLKRNEAIQEMKEYKSNEDWGSLKDSRLEYIGATIRLMQNKLI